MDCLKKPSRSQSEAWIGIAAGEDVGCEACIAARIEQRIVGRLLGVFRAELRDMNVVIVARFFSYVNRVKAFVNQDGGAGIVTNHLCVGVSEVPKMGTEDDLLAVEKSGGSDELPVLIDRSAIGKTGRIECEYIPHLTVVKQDVSNVSRRHRASRCYSWLIELTKPKMRAQCSHCYRVKGW